MELFTEFSKEKVKKRKDIEEMERMTANTSGVTCPRPTPNQLGKEIIREMQNEIINWGLH